MSWMKMNRIAKRATLGALLALTGFASSGCFPAEAVMRPVTMGSAVYIGMYGMALGVTALEPGQGSPTVTVFNVTNEPVQVRYWVGRRDVSTPTGVADIRSRDGNSFVLKPGESVRRKVAKRAGWMSSNTDAIVWVRIDSGADLVLPEHEREYLWVGSNTPQWYELTQPSPVVWRIVENEGQLMPERFGADGAIVPLPEELWIPNNEGEFPSYSTDSVAQR